MSTLPADGVYEAYGQRALLHPVLTSVVVVSAAEETSGMGYLTYFAHASPLHLTHSLFVVTLVIPLLRQMPRIRSARVPLTGALAIGSTTAIVTALAPAVAVHVPPELLASLAPKSTTAAVAVGVADRVGGLPGVTAVVVIATGIVWAAFGPGLLRTAGVRDERAVGFALGSASLAKWLALSTQAMLVVVPTSRRAAEERRATSAVAKDTPDFSWRAWCDRKPIEAVRFAKQVD